MTVSRFLPGMTLASLLLVACSPSAPAPQPDDQAPAPAPSGATDSNPPPTLVPQPIAQGSDLVGEWRVAGIDGGEVAGDMGIAVSITEDTLSYEPRCLGFAWTYHMTGPGRIALARDPRFGPQRAADGSMVSCLPAVTPAFGQLAGALDQVTRANSLSSGGVELSGGGHSVVLFRQ